MNDRTWKPNVTVAAVIERAGRFLLIEEETEGGLRFNQPAGHLDPDESLVEACAREVLEEAAWHFRPTALVGVYQWPRPKRTREGDITYLRFAFAGELGEEAAGRALDAGIVRTLWATPEEIEGSQVSHRSPLIWRCVQDYLAGRRYPLELIRHYG